ncbi:MAG: PKD domain-containing protein [Chitinophagales bacterium]|nr:PKD domain-containing protein [Chitinophagales bacterium]
MRYLYIVLFNLIAANVSIAQLYDYTWVLGYRGGSISPDDDTFGLSILSFQNGELQVTDNQIGEARFHSNNVSFSDVSGNLIFSFNGKAVYAADHQIIENGGMWFDGVFEGGWDEPQSSLMFEHLTDSTLVYLFDMDFNFIYIEDSIAGVGEHIHYSIIDRTQNEGEGAVILRKELLAQDTFDAGKLSACKHANGRDWWILMPEQSSNRFHRFLLTPDGIDTMGVQVIGEPVPTGLGQATFSSDGTKHVRYNGISVNEGEWVSIYDFDRCTGLLSNFQNANLPHGGPSGGTAISKNARYLYTTSNIYIYQYDLWAEDVLATRTLVAEYDGYLDNLPTTFYQAQLAPDGKIYISSSNSVTSIHVIHYPDKMCPDCYIDQHGIELPTRNSFSIPNLPNYRLGPIDSSPCDTLGINNIPLSRWRYEQDTLEPLEVFFTDLSDYEPSEWLWDFGDTSSSTEINPIHLYAEPGTYQVCLTVSNENGSDTKCKELTFEIVNTSSPSGAKETIAKVFPNPFQRYLTFSLRAGWLPTDARILIYDQVGRPVQNRRLSAGMNTLDMGEVPAGVYFYQLIAEGQIVESGKVVKQ